MALISVSFKQGWVKSLWYICIVEYVGLIKKYKAHLYVRKYGRYILKENKQDIEQDRDHNSLLIFVKHNCGWQTPKWLQWSLSPGNEAFV